MQSSLLRGLSSLRSIATATAVFPGIDRGLGEKLTLGIPCVKTEGLQILAFRQDWVGL
jgi:hypothetical protein